MTLRALLPSCCARSSLWIASFLLWATALWILSDGPVPVEQGPEIPNLDKVLHFGYFFGGAGLLSAALYCRIRTRSPGPGKLPWSRLTMTVILVLAAIGALDEWHQSWVPGRFGNDLGDWLADVLGACTGTVIFRHIHHILPSPEHKQPRH